MSQESLLGPYLKPGTPIKVGNYSTKIIRYLSEGGFSHVYTAKLDIPVKGSDVAVLKRIVAPDKHALAAIRTEVETMKKLKGHKYIVTYIDSHASALAVGGFEVYVLMEYCPGGGLIDFMNTRLQTRLAEWEVLKIISDTTEAVACMHYLRPPLLHRDLKIENVLISGNGDYKLCDFGSCTEPRPPATTTQERRDLEEDIQKNTTIQYRSPEMVDVSRRLPIDEKSDIWALGVLLYKLCYFTTPFETQGQLAILNAAYTFPPYPPYTDRTKRLIAVTLQENPRDRPNVYQLLAEICSMRNVPVPIPDIYSRSRSSSQNPRSRPSSRPPTANNDDILTYEAAAAAAPKTPVMAATTKEPMRRGRPERTSSPAKVDPGRILPVSSASNVASKAVPLVDEDDFSAKFPSLEEMDFSLDKEDVAKKESIQSEYYGASRSSAPLADQDALATTLPDTTASEQSRPRTSSEAKSTKPLPAPPVSNPSNDLLEPVERTLRPSEIGKTGTYIRQHGPDVKLELKNTDHQQNTDTAIPSTGPTLLVRPDPIHMERPHRQEPSQKQSSNPYEKVSLMNDRLRARPQMVSRSSQTSPKPQQAMQTQTSPIKPGALPGKNASTAGLSDNLMRDSSGYVIRKPAARTDAQSLPPKPQFKFTTSIDRPNTQMRMHDQAAQPVASNARPQTMHLVPTTEYRQEIADIERSQATRPLEDNRTGTSLDSDVGGRQVGRTNREEQAFHAQASNIRRSVSVSASTHRHGKRPSLTSIPSFSGAAKNIMTGKFSDAFRKFESSTKSRGTTPAVERSNPLQVAEADLPEHVTQHLQSAEARRSSSYSRNRPSFDALTRSEHSIPIFEKSSSVDSTSSSVKDAMRRLNEKATQAYVPQRSAQGYGKYTEPEGITRAATVVPYARDVKEELRRGPAQKALPTHAKNPKRYNLRDDEDESSNFSQRYPSLSDFKV